MLIRTAVLAILLAGLFVTAANAQESQITDGLISPGEISCANAYDPAKCLASSTNGVRHRALEETALAAGINENSCAWFVLSWWMEDARFVQFPTIPLGLIGFLRTPVLASVSFNPELTTPAVVTYCY